MKYKIIDLIGYTERRNRDDIPSKVNSIKGLRAMTGLGLKEAKELIDELWSGESGTAFTVEGYSPDAPGMREAISMVECGACKVDVLDETVALRHLLGDAAKLAMDIGQTEAARDILQVIIDLEI